jgi:hypothetical protein
MAILEWLLELAVVMFVFRVLPRLIFGQRTARRTPPQGAQTRTGGGERVGGALVRDPQCGTFVPESRSVTLGSGSKALHFCSTACRDKWVAAHDAARADGSAVNVEARS